MVIQLTTAFSFARTILTIIFLLSIASTYGLTCKALVEAQPIRQGAEDSGRVERKAGKAKPPFAVVEFFTSENCLRCRQAAETARKLELEALTGNLPIFLLSYHIDYLQKNDWKDPFADARFSERQRDYSQALKLRRLVPGQFFFNAKEQVDSPKYEAVLAYANAALKQPVRASLALEARANRKAKSQAIEADSGSFARLEIDFVISGLLNLRREFVYLHIAVVESGQQRKVTQGPNAGHTFVGTNTVRSFQTERLAKRFSGVVDVALPADIRPERSSVICFVQDPISGRIMAAERLFVSDYL